MNGFNPESEKTTIHLTVNGQAYTLAAGGMHGGVTWTDTLAHIPFGKHWS